MAQLSHSIASEKLWKLLEATQQLNQSTSLEQTLEDVIRLGLDILGSQRGSVFLYHEHDRVLTAQVATGTAEIKVAVGEGIVGECARTLGVINVPDCYKDPRFNAQIDADTGFRSRCLLAIPLLDFDGKLVGVLEVLNKRNGSFDDADEELGLVLGTHCAIAIQRSRWFSDFVTKQKRDHDLAIAREIQQDIIPQSMPDIPTYDMAGWNRAADETGGDIFDIVQLDEHRIFFLLADATGHGIGPALSVMQVRSMARMALRLGADLDQTAKQLNAQLAQDLAANRFVTCFLGILDTQTNRLTYHAAGQGPFFTYQQRSQQWTTHPASTIPLGITQSLPAEAPEVLLFEPGDTLAVMSDGFLEWGPTDGDMFGEERVIEQLNTHQSQTCSNIIENLVQQVSAFATPNPQPDDMTIVLLRRRLP